MAKKEQKPEMNVSLENVVATAIQVPGVKVNRELFLRDQFQKESKELVEAIVENGPVNAQVSQDTLRKMAKKIINERTIVSAGVRKTVKDNLTILRHLSGGVGKQQRKMSDARSKDRTSLIFYFIDTFCENTEELL